MKHFPHLLWQELRSHLFSPATYTAATLFLLLMAYILYSILLDYGTRTQEIIPLEQFFRAYALPVLFMVPLLTMRTLAEERRLGTLETLMTTSVSIGEVVLAKFCGAYLFYLFCWLGALSLPCLAATALERGDATRLLFDPGVLIGGFLYVSLSGLLFIATGVLCSSLTRSQLVSALLCFSVLLALIVVLPALREHVSYFGDWALSATDYFQVAQHMDDFLRGVVDTRPFVYYGINTLLSLAATTLLVETRDMR